ncbi:hypothetical protein yc1106_03326 [Curvularia clavata]|uniref:Uncharacterized protein n=1 Tax=Curvularia clavata TaxID=95742 RepID=A0A9Q8Z5I3_CURCL|nr:hypothetical protein yc1106_03326 [Curvularia clavata]
MASAMLGPLLLALLAQHGAAAVMSAPEATITPAPAILKRAVTTIGYISTREYDGTTYWDTITANEQGNAIATSSNLFQICDPAKPCTFFSCSGDYVILSTSSLFCGGASSTCSFWELKTDINDKNPLTNFWCDAKTSTGGIIYMTTPTPGAVSATGTTKTSAKPVSLSFASASNVASASTIDDSGPGFGQNDSSRPSSKKKSTPIGAIVGGVVGGLAVLAAIIFGVWFVLRKKRNQSASNNTVQQATPGPPPPMQQNAQQPPAGVQYYHEQKPIPQPQVQQVPPQPYGHYDPSAQQAPTQPFYDPNAQPAYAQQPQAVYGAPPPEKTPAMGPQTHSYHADNGPVSPVPQYSPSPTPAVPANVNELSSERIHFIARKCLAVSMEHQVLQHLGFTNLYDLGTVAIQWQPSNHDNDANSPDSPDPLAPIRLGKGNMNERKMAIQEFKAQEEVKQRLLQFCEEARMRQVKFEEDMKEATKTKRKAWITVGLWVFVVFSVCLTICLLAQSEPPLTQFEPPLSQAEPLVFQSEPQLTLNKSSLLSKSKLMPQ